MLYWQIDFEVENLLLAFKASNKYLDGSLDQLKISGGKRPHIICCDN